MVQGPMLVVVLLLAIIFIVVATLKLKLHPFLALKIAAYALAFAAGMPADKIAGVITGGFGSTLTSIGIVILAGCIIGTILEKPGAAIKMAEVIINVVGEKRPTIAMSIIGYIVSIPVFCDSGFVILSSLNKTLAKKTKTSLVAMTVSHANDSYFWVVSQFGGMDVKTAYKTQTVATLLQGIATIITVFIFSLILL
jgi:GntP family gluconate:H+ symporter